MNQHIITWQIGSSVAGEPLKIDVVTAQPLAGLSELAQQPSLLILAGVHGDEVEGVELAHAFYEYCKQKQLSQKLSIIFWLQANPDGFKNQTRHNGRGVDLNRNLATQDWTAEFKNPRYPPGPNAGSEPETQALMQLIADVQPQAILSLHSFHTPQVNANGPSLEWAQALAEVSGYPVTQDIGYPTPGSLGTYAGKERQIPTITLELLRGANNKQQLATLISAVTSLERILKL